MGRRMVGCKSRECGQGIVRERNAIVGDGGCVHCEDEGDVLRQVGVGPLAGAGHDEHALHRPHPEVCARHGRRERRQRVRYLQSARVPKSARDADGRCAGPAAVRVRCCQSAPIPKSARESRGRATCGPARGEKPSPREGRRRACGAAARGLAEPGSEQPAGRTETLREGRGKWVLALVGLTVVGLAGNLWGWLDT